MTIHELKERIDRLALLFGEEHKIRLFLENEAVDGDELCILREEQCFDDPIGIWLR